MTDADISVVYACLHNALGRKLHQVQICIMFPVCTLGTANSKQVEHAELCQCCTYVILCLQMPFDTQPESALSCRLQRKLFRVKQ